MNQRIYLDNAATTPLLPEVIECINHTSKIFSVTLLPFIGKEPLLKV